MGVPKVIHQLWKTADVPARFTALRETWRSRNPDWVIRLWTDAELEALVAERYPELLGLYRAYQLAISRADLGRYLVLETFGGVYADLDCECLRPLDPLLAGREFVIGLEPESHRRDPLVAGSPFEQMLCPSFIACVAGHPFWRFARERAAAIGPVGPVLELTGPFMLTRAYDTCDCKARMSVVAAPVLYPFDKLQCWEDEISDLAVWERLSRRAFVAHFWDGGWFRPPSPLDGLPKGIAARLGWSGDATPPVAGGAPLAVSCITVADGWSPGLVGAVESYLRQTVRERELVVASDDPAVAEGLAAYAAPDIRLAPAPAGLDEEARRAIAVAAAKGPLLCRWDAGERQDPRRLEIQRHVLTQSGADAVVLLRRPAWLPAGRRMAIPAPAPRASSLMVRADRWRSGLDEPDAFRAFVAAGKTAAIDVPRLSLKAFAADEQEAFAALWRDAAARFEGDRCDAVVDELAKRLPVRDQRGAAPASARPGRTAEIVVLTPVKNGRRYLPRYLELLCRLADAAGAPLAVAFMEGDSADGTYDALLDARASLERRFARVEVHRRHDGFRHDGEAWDPHVQRARRATIARARNRLAAAALGDAAWALWLDVDLIDYPPDLLQRMLDAGRDIVAANCVFADGEPFDLNTFAFDPAGAGRDSDDDLVDGLYQPPPGKGRLYLTAMTDQPIAPVDGVGGTALLVRGDLHRRGLDFPDAPYRGYIETEGLAMKARDMGVRAWGLPGLRVVHAARG